MGTVRQAVEIFEGRKSCLIDTSVSSRSSETSVMAETTYALPSPTDTPYRTPSSSRSRQTSRTYEDLSPATTPPPLPPHDRLAKRSSNDSISALDESLPLSDPRRFTPTLHASLVSEILSLRRDAETRLKDIERYEQNLHNAQIQNETLNNSLLAANRETRQARRQMQILEGGTLSAINELTKERDAAQNDAAELRIRLDQAQKKVKSHEESIDHVQDQWQKDKDGWLAEKRTLETKIHIVEGRLKVVLSEVAKAQQIRASEEHFQSPRRSQSRTSMLGSPRKRPESAVMRRQSRDSVLSDYAGGRTSVLSFANGEAVNLADELALEDIDELDYASHDDEDEYASPGPTHDEQQARPPSKVSLKAWKVLGIPIDLSDFDRSEPGARDKALRNLEGEDALRTVSKPAYVDTGVQYSRPSSPVPEPRRSVETPVSRFRDSLGTIRASKSLSVVSQDSAHFSVDTSDNAWEENLRNQPIMVSSSCQTVEQIPSPPQTLVAQSSLTTIDETIEMREIATQTDTPPRASASTLTVHKRTDTEQTSGSIELQIPTIAIIPPTSRPVTPDDLSVTLPPRTKNAGCQVESYVLCDTNSIGVQTEDIRIDKRSMIPPHPPMAPPPVPGSIPQPNFNKTKNQAFSRRNVPNAANSSIRRTTPVQGLPPINDDGPLSDGGNREIGRPVRSSSMFAGFDEGEDLGDSGDDVFHDDDFFNKRPTRFVLSRGKLMAADKTLDDIEETEAAVAAGKRFALEQIRLSEENDRDFEIEGSFHLRSLPRQSSKQVKRIPSSRTSHMRRAALISSGTAVHQAKSSLSSLGSGDNSRPPMPIPVRYSSARVGKSSSDGGRSSRGSSNASPTRPGRRSARPIIRKTRSGPALSPAGQFARKDRSGSRSPPLDNRVSIVPEMPNFKMPSEQKELPVLSSGYATSFGASAPRPSIAQGPMRKTSHVKENSDSFAAQQTSVVDAIAQTMVGEWMFKYVRRRKSFGKPEKEWDPSKSVEEMSSGASSGTRHKRWVWLAPYEKSVMWSSKQPTDGTSLLGKSGRKRESCPYIVESFANFEQCPSSRFLMLRTTIQCQRAAFRVPILIDRS